MLYEFYDAFEAQISRIETMIGYPIRNSYIFSSKLFI